MERKDVDCSVTEVDVVAHKMETRGCNQDIGGSKPGVRARRQTGEGNVQHVSISPWDLNTMDEIRIKHQELRQTVGPTQVCQGWHCGIADKAVSSPSYSTSIQLPAKGLEKVGEDGPSVWSFTIHLGYWEKFLAPGFGLILSCLCGNEPQMEDTHSFSLFLCFYLFVSLFL